MQDMAIEMKEKERKYTALLNAIETVKPDTLKELLDTIQNANQLSEAEWSSLVVAAITKIQKCLFFDKSGRNALMLILSKLAALVTPRECLPLSEAAMELCLDQKINLIPALKEARNEQGFSIFYFFLMCPYESVRELARPFCRTRVDYWADQEVIDEKDFFEQLKAGDIDLYSIFSAEFFVDNDCSEDGSIYIYTFELFNFLLSQIGIPEACLFLMDIEEQAITGLAKIGDLFKAGHEEELSRLVVGKDMSKLRFLKSSYSTIKPYSSSFYLLNKVVIDSPYLDGKLDFTLEFLLRRGANPNVCSPEGLTPLHENSLRERPQTAVVLLRYGADPNMPGCECRHQYQNGVEVVHNKAAGLSPFFYHARFTSQSEIVGFRELADILISHGAKIDGVLTISGRLLKSEEAVEDPEIRDYLKYKLWEQRNPYSSRFPRLVEPRPRMQTEFTQMYVESRELEISKRHDAQSIRTLLLLWKHRRVGLINRIPRDVVNYFTHNFFAVRPATKKAEKPESQSGLRPNRSAEK